MSPAEIQALLAEVARGSITAKTALALLTANGIEQHDAARRVFYAVGGSDKTELDAEGRVRYAGSGKLVAEVERAITE